MSGFADVFQQLCGRHPDERDRGRAFEPLVAQVLRSDPLYKAQFAEVWRWSEWPGRDGGDIGIDIVAQRHDGGLAAIQSKCQTRIDKDDINSFLADSQRRLSGEPYVERYLFTTATEWSDNAERAISRIDPPVQRVDFFGLDGALVDWDQYLRDESVPLQAKPRKQLRPHQVSALNDVLSGLQNYDRGKLIMACGTGKTLTALRIAEKVAGQGGGSCSLLLHFPCWHSRCESGARIRKFLFVRLQYVQIRGLVRTTEIAPAPTTCRFQLPRTPMRWSAQPKPMCPAE